MECPKREYGMFALVTLRRWRGRTLYVLYPLSRYVFLSPPRYMLYIAPNGMRDYLPPDEQLL